MTEVRAVDVFAGAGGLSLGAQMAGAAVVATVDLDGPSCDTLRANPQHSECEVVEADVMQVTGEFLRDIAGDQSSSPFIIIGGAPCQPFSKAAYWLDPGDDAQYRRARERGERLEKPPPPAVRDDDRRSLVGEFWRLVVDSRADGFVFENVPSIAHPRNRPVLEALESAARSAGYATVRLLANATDFGVAQRRKRVFVLGARRTVPAVPERTHGPEELSGHLKPLVSAGEVLEPFSGTRYFEPEEEVHGRWAEHLREIPPGWNYKWHTAWAGHPSPTFVAEARFWNFLLKLDPALPSWTLPASPGPWVGPFHWESRRLRTAEMAALQGFPDGYRFVGNRRERIRQIGNAVPPPLGEAMVRAVVDAVRGTP